MADIGALSYVQRGFEAKGRKRMEEFKASPAPSSDDDQLTVPSWAYKEDQRARHEDHADGAEGYHFVWVLIFATLPPLAALAWRLAT